MNWWQEMIVGGLVGTAIAVAVLYVAIEFTEYMIQVLP
jgi:hypothetical protein